MPGNSQTPAALRLRAKQARQSVIGSDSDLARVMLIEYAVELESQAALLEKRSQLALISEMPVSPDPLSSVVR